MEKLTVIKIGGNIIDDAIKLDSFLTDFASVEGHKILVHGGGKLATELGNKLGIASEYVNGRRVTDEQTLGIVTMVYGGLINKNIVAKLQSKNCNAIGLAGADGNLLLANKRAVGEVDYGFVGDISAAGVNVELVQSLLATGLVPVLAPLTHNGKGSMLNTNADTIAQEVAKAMAATMEVRLIYCFEKKGLLKNADDPGSVISNIDKATYSVLKNDNVIFGGMIPKLDNAFAAIDNGVSEVLIGHSDDLQDLILNKAGTQVK